MIKSGTTENSCIGRNMKTVNEGLLIGLYVAVGEMRASWLSGNTPGDNRL